MDLEESLRDHGFSWANVFNNQNDTLIASVLEVINTDGAILGRELRAAVRTIAGSHANGYLIRNAKRIGAALASDGVQNTLLRDVILAEFYHPDNDADESRLHIPGKGIANQLIYYKDHKRMRAYLDRRLRRKVSKIHTEIFTIE